MGGFRRPPPPPPGPDDRKKPGLDRVKNLLKTRDYQGLDELNVDERYRFSIQHLAFSHCSGAAPNGQFR